MTPKQVLTHFVAGDWELLEEYAKVKFPYAGSAKRKQISQALAGAMELAFAEEKARKELEILDPSREDTIH